MCKRAVVCAHGREVGLKGPSTCTVGALVPALCLVSLGASLSCCRPRSVIVSGEQSCPSHVCVCASMQVPPEVACILAGIP